MGCVAAAGADGALASPASGGGAVPAADAAAPAGVAVAGAVVGAATESPPASARGTEMGAAVVTPLPLPPPLPVPLPVVLSPKAPMGSPAAMTDRDAWPAVSRVGRRERRRIVSGGGGEGGRAGGGGGTGSGTGSGARTPPRQPGTGLPLRPKPSRRRRPSHGMEGGKEGWALQQRGGELPVVCLTGAVGVTSGEGKGGRSSARFSAAGGCND